MPHADGFPNQRGKWRAAVMADKFFGEIGPRGFLGAAILGLATMVGRSTDARAEEIIYQGILNAGNPPFATRGSMSFPAGTMFTATVTFSTSSGDQWSPGAYIYTATSGLFAFKSGTAPPETYRVSIPDKLDILLSDPTWEIVLGPGPYTAGFISISSFGSFQSVFEAATFPFSAAEPSPSTFYDYSYSFLFTDKPFVIPVVDLTTHSEDLLSIYTNSISDATASIVPETSTWAMLLIGFGELGFVAYRRRRKGSAAQAAV
jgi:hypothetical protein